MTAVETADLPVTAPVTLAPDTFLITNMAPAGPGEYLPVDSVLIRGEEPVIVDTGAPIHRELWLDQVFDLVAPEDVRWVFLSHDDGDHTGALHEVLDLCPNATLVANFFSTERLALEKALPLHRMVWREDTEYVDTGDRRLRLVVPPIFDGPATRGVLDERPA
ncbi:MBL fold metallo-hydrolase [Nocardioides guangzhouensis]|uniref:MBL fold metallo-hydrolase n=1 Tax=Nocardioides guangzhouensis TaxID=2497878 RepID=A0A4Q4Z3R9_9ACTN|nr:MBL fold metallo-hydrolase [Nocardioides guangzhouensis]RYP81611.1 MBL fold metallo-hydrolase [Nocardioides guangzhouensis]